jgi:putative phosphoribosyl transferase
MPRFRSPESYPESYPDRAAAGRELAARLVRAHLHRPVVLALPRGGVPVGRPVADALKAPLDVLVVRKVGAPGREELGLGAVGEEGVTVLDLELIRYLGIGEERLEQAVAKAREELERRLASLPPDRSAVDVTDRDVVIVDDGIATGGTALAAVDVMRHRGAGRVVVAVPVASADGLARLEEVADEVVCPRAVRGGFAVGAFYEDFHQLDDAEVAALLATS